MGTRQLTAPRCATCRMLETLCVCALIPKLETQNRLLLLMHTIEEKKTTNSGRLATLALTNSRLMVQETRIGSPDTIGPDEHNLVVLFPSHDAIPLARSAEPVTLVVPDASWRQAGRLLKREARVAGLPRRILTAGTPSRYGLRQVSRPGGLSTFEAIARAMGILEGPEIEQSLLSLFAVFVGRTLWSRGDMPAADVPGGIPDAARYAGRPTETGVAKPRDDC